MSETAVVPVMPKPQAQLWLPVNFFFFSPCYNSTGMVQRASDREEASAMAHPKRTRSFSPSSSGPLKRTRTSRKQQSSQSKEPTTFFQRILKTFTSQSQDPQLTTDEESSYSSNTEVANAVSVASTSAFKKREASNVSGGVASSVSAGTPNFGQSDSDGITQSSHFEGKQAFTYFEKTRRKTIPLPYNTDLPVIPSNHLHV